MAGLLDDCIGTCGDARRQVMHGWLVGRIVKLRLVITLAFFALKNAQNIFLCRESYLKPPVTDCFDGILLH